MKYNLQRNHKLQIHFWNFFTKTKRDEHADFVLCRRLHTFIDPSQVAKIVDLLLGQYTISMWAEYCGNAHFWKIPFDIQKVYIDPIIILSLSQYQLIIVSILTLYSLFSKEYWLNAHFLILKFQYWPNI